jgi:diadenosine tetraphosphate (Ap4A) HIT family hydrolase
MKTDFTLHAQLAADTHVVTDLPLSRVLLMDDGRFPWLILVPRQAGMRDWIDLPREHQHQLLDEVERCAQALRQLYVCEKLNIAALGNVVAQLHVHVIARSSQDAVWPRPVWGAGEARRYARDTLLKEVARLKMQIEKAAPQ